MLSVVSCLMLWATLVHAAPSISAMYTLLTKLTTLPTGFLTAQQLSEFQGKSLRSLCVGWGSRGGCCC